MYSRGVITQRSLAFFIMTILIFVALLLFSPEGLDSILYQNWICDCFCLEFALLSLIYMYANKHIDFFSPVLFVSAIYILMFFVTPLYDISIGKTSVFGVTDLFDYGVKGSIYALLGYISFIVVFCHRQKIQMNRYDKTVLTYQLSTGAVKTYETGLLAAWIAVFVLAVVLVVTTKGFSISYVLSFGLFGNADGYEGSSSFLGFIGQFTRCIVTICLLYIFISKNKPLKFLLFILTAMLEIINGFRYMIVILILGYFYTFYLTKNKRVRAIHIFLFVILISFLVGIVGYTRGSVRSGMGFNISGLTANDIVDAVVGNFRIYKSYYSLIKAVPRMTRYLYFDQMLIYTLIMAIPRAIWPSKPGNPGTTAQLYGLNQAAVLSGFAYPGLGEYYYSFGVIGIIFFMGVIGAWLANISIKYRLNAKNRSDLVIYSITVGLMLQLLIRGYTPSNFYLIIAMYIPYWISDSYIKHHSITE